MKGTGMAGTGAWCGTQGLGKMLSAM